ncbi:hypothetical protein DQ237_00240 [Blastococcus sp. TF02-8]|uniref:hypothetical protein n=1 Tax=Blastococcus sp. TF02-8 TaxID=2250574 RepID=UPI000DEA41E2|nr:hypothetical protein [Blastococcus sp. TF02-8]RBY97437.1 hypothetical protein DQ237_00240 [Blastococcus sp. TF02-8]
MTSSDIPSAYIGEKRTPAPSREELRARIPGWGVDLDPADRPSNPKLLPGPDTGAHWDFPERQPGSAGRERSIEHAFVTPVFGTAQPLKGVSGAIRRLAYDRFSEGRLAHWMLLVVGDRVDAVEGHLASIAGLRPDVPATGLRAELTHGGLGSRRGRVDARHHVLDPFVVGGPWLVAAGAAVLGARRVVRALRR